MLMRVAQLCGSSLSQNEQALTVTYVLPFALGDALETQALLSDLKAKLWILRSVYTSLASQGFWLE